jgi:hypothetical protein
LEKHLANPVKRLTIAVERLTNVVERFVDHGGCVVYRLLPDTHDSRLVTVGVGEGRARTAVILVAQACEVGLTLLAPRSLAGKSDVEAAAAKP